MTLPRDLPFSLEREVVIRAPRATVFRFFTDSARFASWWGEGSTIEARAGGAVRILLPGGARASGEVLALEPDARIVFTYGYDAGAPIPPGGSRVTVALADDPAGTRLHLRHDVADATARDLHVQGWRFQLSLFANAAAAAAHPDADAAADRWFAAWNEPDPAVARDAFEALATADVAFHDAFSCLSGLDDIAAHVAASKAHLPGVRLERDGPARHTQGAILADWTALRTDGTSLGRGTNLFELAPDGKVRRAVGFRTPNAGP